MNSIPTDFTTTKATNATCSCGRAAAGHCTCDKSAVENQPLVGKPSCTCGKRAAGTCTCERAAQENGLVSGTTCSCGARPADGKEISRVLMFSFLLTGEFLF